MALLECGVNHLPRSCCPVSTSVSPLTDVSLALWNGVPFPKDLWSLMFSDLSVNSVLFWRQSLKFDNF